MSHPSLPRTARPAGRRRALLPGPALALVLAAAASPPASAARADGADARATVTAMIEPPPRAQVATAAVASLHGHPVPAQVGGTLAGLVDQAERPFRPERLGGRPTLLFFGFLHCGATCPVSLAGAQQALQSASPTVPPNVVFVTLDPLADSPARLGALLVHVDPRIVGLTGSPAQVERVAEAYGVAARPDGAGLAHSAMWYLLDGAGRVVRVYDYLTPGAELRAEADRLTRLGGDFR